MTENKIVIENPKSTVVANYQAESRTETQYQSEAALEKAFIQRLQGQAYEYLPLHTEQDLISNLRRQMEKLNGISFTDAEWKRFYNTILANQNNGIVEKTRLIQEDNVQTFLFDNGDQKNLRIFDRKNVHNNRLQVINQYTPEGGKRENRYDVTILVAGCAHPRGLQPNQPLPARVVLERHRSLPVRADLCHLQRHRDEILQQHHSLCPCQTERRQAKAGTGQAHQQLL